MPVLKFFSATGCELLPVAGCRRLCKRLAGQVGLTLREEGALSNMGSPTQISIEVLGLLRSCMQFISYHMHVVC